MFIFSDTLQEFKAALVQLQKAEADLQEQLTLRKEPEMAAKYKECEEAEKKLKEIEHKLGTAFTQFDLSGLKREREMFYLTTHSTHFIYGYMASDIWLRTILRKATLIDFSRCWMSNICKKKYFFKVLDVKHL